MGVRGRKEENRNVHKQTAVLSRSRPPARLWAIKNKAATREKRGNGREGGSVANWLSKTSVRGE